MVGLGYAFDTLQKNARPSGPVPFRNQGDFRLWLLISAGWGIVVTLWAIANIPRPAADGLDIAVAKAMGLHNQPDLITYFAVAVLIASAPPVLIPPVTWVGFRIKAWVREGYTA